MSILETPRGLARCPECGGTGEPTEWRAEGGFDLAMRQFFCRSCRAEFYLVMVDNEHIKAADERSREMMVAREIAKD